MAMEREEIIETGTSIIKGHEIEEDKIPLELWMVIIVTMIAGSIMVISGIIGLLR